MDKETVTAERLDSDFDDAIGANGPEAKAAFEAREAKRQEASGHPVTFEPEIEEAEPTPLQIEQQRAAEVAELLKNAGLKREDIENWGSDDDAGADVKTIIEPTESTKELTEKLSDIKVEGPFPEFPVELITKAINSNLTKMEVANLVEDFRMNVSLGEIEAKAYSIVVTDVSQKDLMKQARELRLLLKQERLRIDANAAAVKEPYLRKIQVIDPTRKHIIDMFKKVESHLHLQEDFEKNELAKQAEKIRLMRVAELTALECENLEHIDLSKITDEAYESIKANAQAAYDLKQEALAAAEAARVLREEKAQIRSARQLQLSQLGMTFNGYEFIYESITFPANILDEGTVDEFNLKLAEVTPLIAQAKERKEKEKEKVQKVLDRKSSLVKLGMVCNEAECLFGEVSISASMIENMTDIEWSAEFDRLKSSIDAINTAEAQKKELAERTQNRVSYLANLGFVRKDDRFEHEASKSSVTVTVVENADSEEFKTVYLAMKSAVDEYNAAQKRIADDAAAIVAQKAEEARQEAARKLAPEKEKLEMLAHDLEVYSFPEMETAIGKLAIDDARKNLINAAGMLRSFIEQLNAQPAVTAEVNA